MSGLSELDLLTIDAKTGKPPESRLGAVTAADSIYKTLLLADDTSAQNRAKYRAMFDGAAPYDSALLAVSGQAARTNLNFGEAGRYLDVAVAGYVDLINAVETLVNVSLFTEPDGPDPMYWETVIAEESTRALRDWPEFHTRFLQLVTEFIIHGVGVALFDTPDDFRFRTCGFGDFLIPRQTLAAEHAVEVACHKGGYMLHELYGHVRNEEHAKQLGWNIAEAKRAMLKSAKTTDDRSYTNYEALQAELKNNDISVGVRANTIQTVTTYTREFDGRVTMTIHCEHDAKDYLFRSDAMFETPERAFLLFANGVGTNGTYHSVRGLGHRIFHHVQYSNRLRSQAIDGAMLSSAVMLKPDSSRAMEDLAISYYGPYAILPPNISITEKAVPNLSQSVMPVIADLGEQMRENLDFYTTKGAAAGSPYRTKLQVQAELEASTRLSSSNLNLFYASWRRLLREVVRRLSAGPVSDSAIREFRDRCAARGVGPEILKRIDHSRTIAVRAVGAGNASARVAALTDLNEVLPLLDPYGKKNLLFDRVAARVGFDTARRYVSPSEEQRPSYDAKLAKLENSLLRTGSVVDVSDTDMHEIHLIEHLPVIQEQLSGYESGQLDGQQLLPALSASHQHVATHIEALSGDPTAAAIVAAASELAANAEMVLGNLQREAQKLERDAASEAGGTGVDTRLQELKLAELEQRVRLKEIEHESTMAMKQADFEQKMALRDVTARATLENSSTIGLD